MQPAESPFGVRRAVSLSVASDGHPKALHSLSIASDSHSKAFHSLSVAFDGHPKAFHSLSIGSDSHTKAARPLPHWEMGRNKGWGAGSQAPR
jgi:hypothetical protein